MSGHEGDARGASHLYTMDAGLTWLLQHGSVASSVLLKSLVWKLLDKLLYINVAHNRVSEHGGGVRSAGRLCTMDAGLMCEQTMVETRYWL